MLFDVNLTFTLTSMSRLKAIILKHLDDLCPGVARVNLVTYLPGIDRLVKLKLAWQDNISHIW